MENLKQSPSKAILTFKALLLSVALMSTINQLEARDVVHVYDFPGGERFASEDYTVTIEQNNKKYESFVYYNKAQETYDKFYSWDRKIKQVFNRPAENRSVSEHSTAIFSFDGEITVRVQVNPSAEHISLPLTSARVLPTSYGIDSWIENGDTIVFKLDKPRKVAVVPNYDEAWQLFVDLAEDHKPIRYRADGHDQSIDRPNFKGGQVVQSLSEGFKNPLFVFGMPVEDEIPNKHAPSTLVINPGDEIKQEKMDQYRTVWFKPGYHDLSHLGTHPYHQTMIRGGQTFYLEGGSYLAARIKKDTTTSGISSVIGRGVISGINHEWFVGHLEDGSEVPGPLEMEALVYTSYHDGGQVIDVDRLIGVNVTEVTFFGIVGGSLIRDVTMTGTWHGNNDGIDYVDNGLIEDCFLMAHDDNLKITDGTHARGVVIWQLENAHPIMMKEVRDGVTYSNTTVEDIDVIAYFIPKRWTEWSTVTHSVIGMTTAGDITVNNFTFRDIRIESPYIYRVFSIYNMDQALPYAPIWFAVPTSEEIHTRIDGVTLENITVNSPLIMHRSLIGSAYDNSLSNIDIINLNINGTVVNESNYDEFIEIKHDKVDGLRILESR